MFALVKFVEEFDSNRLYVVDSHSILDFHPRNTNDFDNRSVYSVFWVGEENHDNTRAYKAQVLLLAESREELETKKSSKRVQIPKIRMEESSGDEWESKKQEHKQSPKKTRWSTETSSGDESLISSAELRREIAEKKMWRSRAEKLEKQNELLLEQVASLQRCLESKIFQVEAIHDHGYSVEAKEIRVPPVKQAAVGRTVPEGDFVHLPDGSFHLTKGIIITASQAAKILSNKKPTLVCKDTAQAIWGTDGLAERSVCGVAAPKARAAGELPKQALTPRKVDVVAVLALSKIDPSKYQGAVEILMLAQDTLRHMKMGPTAYWKPSQAGLLIYSSVVLSLAEELISLCGYKYLLTSHLIQDCLGNIFSIVRMNKPVPSAYDAKTALKLICVGQFLHTPKSSSYDSDYGFHLADLIGPSLGKSIEKIRDDEEHLEDLLLEEVSPV
ncbi:hypothetical protein HPB50_029117 [Hyalomma asiaticum]|nr:hypothetical protein HPB50_029117 [Hyalomma asiaticum]